MVLVVHHVQLERRGLMFTLNRLSVSSSTITLALGLMLGGCASETEEPDPSMPAAVEADQAAAPVEAADPADALPADKEEHLGKNASEIGFYGGWGYPMYAGYGWGYGMPFYGYGMGYGWGGAAVARSATFVSSTAYGVGVPMYGGWGWGAGASCGVGVGMPGCGW